MVGRLLPASSLASFKDAVLRQQSPDLVSKNLAAELLADQVGIGFFGLHSTLSVRQNNFNI